MLFFCLFQCFAEKEYQTESKRNETFGRVIFGTNVIQGTWSGRQVTEEAATRVSGAPPTLVGPSSVHRPTSSSYIYPCSPRTSKATTKNYFHHFNLLYREIPSWSLRRRSAGGGIDHGGPLHHLQGLSGEL